MSPSEDDLRAALHQGEGAAPNMNRILAAGAAKRAQRRNIATVVTAGFLVVGGVGTGIAALGGGNTDAGGSSNKNAAADRGAENNRPFPLRSPSASTAPGAGQAPADSRAAACPTTFPRPSGTPGGPGSAVFTDAVRSVVVCAYGSDLDIAAKAAPAQLTLTGNDATALASSLETARKTPAGRTCLPARTQNLVLVATSDAGRTLPAVTVTYSDSQCDGRVTNGTALRYGWSPPPGLLQSLESLSPKGTGSPPNHSPSGKNHGTPVR